jgi:hypothetical protein
LVENGLPANFDKPFFFVESQGSGIGRIDVNLTDQPRNAACGCLSPQIGVEVGRQVMSSGVFGYNDAIDVNEVFVTGLEPEEIRVVVIRLRQKGQEKTGDTFRRNCYLENDASFEIRINFGRSSGLRNCSDCWLSAKISGKSDCVATRNWNLLINLEPSRETVASQ